MSLTKQSMANIIMTVFSCIIFYIIISPVAFILKLFGSQFLELKIDKSAKSYWRLRGKI